MYQKYGLFTLEYDVADRCTGIHGLGLYCIDGDAIQVTLAGVSLVSNNDCKPISEEGIVFKIVPLYLPKGFYEFEYTIRTKRKTMIMIAEALREFSPGIQPPGRISAAAGVLYMPASANDLIMDVNRGDMKKDPVPIRVVDHGYGR